MALQISPAQAKSIDRNGSGIDWSLATVLTCLLLFGFVMVFSASYPWALENRDSPFYYVLLQLRWLGVGLAVLVGAATSAPGSRARAAASRISTTDSFPSAS